MISMYTYKPAHVDCVIGELWIDTCTRHGLPSMWQKWQCLTMLNVGWDMKNASLIPAGTRNKTLSGSFWHCLIAMNWMFMHPKGLTLTFHVCGTGKWGLLRGNRVTEKSAIMHAAILLPPFTVGRHCEKVRSVSQKEGSQQTTDLLASWGWPSQPTGLWEMNSVV